MTNLMINLVGGTLVSIYAFRAARAGEVGKAILLGAVYIAIALYFN